jgi:multidrug efflux pump subunit AcrA (membrane-fusion protein)
MKKIVFGILTVIIVSGAVYWFALRPQTSQPINEKEMPTAEALAAFSPANSDEVEALGHLVPAQYSDLHFRTNGVIQSIFVKEGQEVQKGDILAKLEGEEQLKLAVSQANLDVMNAEKAISDLEINAPLQAAQAFYDMSQAEKELDDVNKDRTSMDYPRATQEDIDDAYKEYKDAEKAFDTVSEYYNPSDDVYKQAKAIRNNTLSAYNWLISKYSDLDKVETESRIVLLEQQITDLNRKYEIYSQGPDPTEVALAQALLQLAIDQRTVAQANYEDLTLYAPFSGTVVQLNFSEGKSIAATQPLLLLANLNNWNVETEDLTELSVTRIKEGASAEVSIDALSNITFEGTVIAINELGETKRGDITYTVVINLAENDPRLRWNMTSPITIAAVSD